MNAGDREETGPSGTWLEAVAAVSETVRALFDARLRRFVTPGLMPVIYVSLIVAIAALDLYAAILAFDCSRGFGLIWLLLMPVFFIAGVGAVRICLEFMLAIFRIGDNVERLVEQLHNVSGQTETIAADLPRIQFWRTRESRLGAANRKNETANAERRDKNRSLK